MFDERRQRITAGIDKSYLLDPIVVETKTSTTTTTKRSVAPATRPVRYDQKMTNYSKVIVPPLQNRLINHDVNGNKNFTIGDDPLERTIRAGDSTRNTKIGVARKLTPAVSSPSPLKNVTNQKVRRRDRFHAYEWINIDLKWRCFPRFRFHLEIQVNVNSALEPSRNFLIFLFPLCINFPRTILKKSFLF